MNTQETTYTTYILAFGPHPDDVEVGAGGVVGSTSAEGKRNVIIDLSPSQMSTYGDPITRQQEAQVAASMLGVAERKNLWLPDTQLTNDPATRLLLAEQIRFYKPEIVVMPRKDDRHPDHTICAELVKQALFLAWLPKQAIADLAPHKPRLVLHYQIWHEFTPDLVISLSDEIFTRKMAAFKSYVS